MEITAPNIALPQLGQDNVTSASPIIKLQFDQNVSNESFRE